jgi:hypothetical protein
MLTHSLKFKLTSDYLAVLRILHKVDVIKEDSRFAYVGIQQSQLIALKKKQSCLLVVFSNSGCNDLMQ